MWFYFWWGFCCCFWFFAVSSKNGELHTQQWTGLRVLWTALYRAGLCLVTSSINWYITEICLEVYFLCGKKTPDLAALKPPHLTFGSKQNQLCSKTCYSLKGFSKFRFRINFSDTISQSECLIAQDLKQFYVTACILSRKLSPVIKINKNLTQ